MQPYQQRVVDEKAELDERLQKLTAFFDTPTYENLNSAERARLLLQAGYMAKYSVILGERIAAFEETL